MFRYLALSFSIGFAISLNFSRIIFFLENIERVNKKKLNLFNHSSPHSLLQQVLLPGWVTTEPLTLK